MKLVQAEGLSAFRMELDKLREKQWSRAFISGRLKVSVSGCNELLVTSRAGVFALTILHCQVWKRS